jgi:MFS family permease
MVTMTLQGFVTNVWQLFAMRALQGAFVGTIPAATALVAAGTPKERVAYALGLLQMGLFTSQFVGPLAGGVLASSIGFRPTFIATGGFYLLSFLLVYFLVDEKFEAPAKEERSSILTNLRVVVERRQLLALIAIVFMVNAGMPFVRPIVPLMIESFDPRGSVETLAGFAFAAMAITSAITAVTATRLSDRVGYRNALALMTLGAGAAYLPVAMAANVPSLILLIGVVGLFTGGMIPTVNALIDFHAPPGKQASAFGLAGSAMALAFATAPLTGGAVAASAGIETAFVVIGCATLAVAGVVLLLVREPIADEGRVVEPVGEAGG